MSFRPKCKTHGVPLVSFCPACRGSVRSSRKVRASRRNGRLGGRPKKEKPEEEVALRSKIREAYGRRSRV